MTPSELARTECANHESSGSCLGVNIGDGLGQTLMPDLAGKPCLVPAGQRCQYFEACVLPCDSTGAVAVHYRNGIRRAGGMVPERLPLAAAVRTCALCGGPRPVKARFCAECARKRRRQRQSEYVSARRESDEV